MVTHMKTTVEVPDELLSEIQQIARAEGTTMRSLMEEGLRAVIARHQSSRQFAMRDASIGGRGLQPEFAGASWERIRAASYGERL
jgi:predicted transcriptional regulator